MATAKDDMSRLIALQEHDKQLDVLRAELAKIPEDIEAMRAQVSDEKAAVEAAHEHAQELQARKKERENEMSKNEEGVKKHEIDLNSVKTNEAFKALLKEIEEAKAAVGNLETEIIGLLDEIDAAFLKEKTAKADLEESESENNKKIRVLEDRKGELEARLKGEEEKRAGLTEGVPADVSTLYDKTRERRGGIALAEVRDGTCRACHVRQPPQVLVDLKKGTKIMVCESCTRLLYEVASAPAESA